MPRHLLALCLLGLLSCGARTPLGAPDGAGGSDTSTDASTTTGAPRSCSDNCTVGHRCCVASCNGPSVKLPSDCCVCLPGEVNSMTCDNDVCGGD